MEKGGENSASHSVGSLQQNIDLNQSPVLSQVSEAPTNQLTNSRNQDTRQEDTQGLKLDQDQQKEDHQQYKEQLPQTTKGGKKRPLKQSTARPEGSADASKKKHHRQAAAVKTEFGQLTSAQRAYWQRKLPAGFDYYLGRIACAVITSQPPSILDFCSEFLDNLFRERISELARLPTKSYLDKLYERKFGPHPGAIASSCENLSDGSTSAVGCLATELDPQTIHSGGGANDSPGFDDVTSRGGAEKASSQQTWFTAQQTASEQTLDQQTASCKSVDRARMSPTAVDLKVSRDKGRLSNSCSFGSFFEVNEVYQGHGGNTEVSKQAAHDGVSDSEAEAIVKSLLFADEAHPDSRSMAMENPTVRNTNQEKSIGRRRFEMSFEVVGSGTVELGCTENQRSEVFDVNGDGTQYQINLGTIGGVPFQISFTPKMKDTMCASRAEQRVGDEGSAEEIVGSENPDLVNYQRTKSSEKVDGIHSGNQMKKNETGHAIINTTKTTTKATATTATTTTTATETTTTTTTAATTATKQIEISNQVEESVSGHKGELVTPSFRSVKNIIQQFKMSELRGRGLNPSSNLTKARERGNKSTCISSTKALINPNIKQNEPQREMLEQRKFWTKWDAAMPKTSFAHVKPVEAEGHHCLEKPKPGANFEAKQEEKHAASATAAPTANAETAEADRSVFIPCSSKARLARSALLMWWSKAVGKGKTKTCKVDRYRKEICGRKGVTPREENGQSQGGSVNQTAKSRVDTFKEKREALEKAFKRSLLANFAPREKMGTSATERTPLSKRGEEVFTGEGECEEEEGTGVQRVNTFQQGERDDPQLVQDLKKHLADQSFQFKPCFEGKEKRGLREDFVPGASSSQDEMDAKHFKVKENISSFKDTSQAEENLCRPEENTKILGPPLASSNFRTSQAKLLSELTKSNLMVPLKHISPANVQNGSGPYGPKIFPGDFSTESFSNQAPHTADNNEAERRTISSALLADSIENGVDIEEGTGKLEIIDKPGYAEIVTRSRTRMMSSALESMEKENVFVQEQQASLANFNSLSAVEKQGAEPLLKRIAGSDKAIQIKCCSDSSRYSDDASNKIHTRETPMSLQDEAALKHDEQEDSGTDSKRSSLPNSICYSLYDQTVRTDTENQKKSTQRTYLIEDCCKLSSSLGQDGSLREETCNTELSLLTVDAQVKNEASAVTGESTSQDGDNGELPNVEKALLLARHLVEELERVADEVETVYHTRKVVNLSAVEDAAEFDPDVGESEERGSIRETASMEHGSPNNIISDDKAQAKNGLMCAKDENRDTTSGLRDTVPQCKADIETPSEYELESSNSDHTISIPGLFNLSKSLLEDVARAILLVCEMDKDKASSRTPLACFRFVGEDVVFKVQPKSTSVEEDAGVVFGAAGRSCAGLDVPGGEASLCRAAAAVGSGISQVEETAGKPEEYSNHARRSGPLRRAGERSSNDKPVSLVGIDTNSAEKEVVDNKRAKERNKNTNNRISSKTKCARGAVRGNSLQRRSKMKRKFQVSTSENLKMAFHHYSKKNPRRSKSPSFVLSHRTRDISNNSNNTGDEGAGTFGRRDTFSKSTTFNQYLVGELTSMIKANDAGCLSTNRPPTIPQGVNAARVLGHVCKSQNLRHLGLNFSSDLLTPIPVCCSSAVNLANLRADSEDRRSRSAAHRREGKTPTRWLYKSGGILGISGQSQSWFERPTEKEEKETREDSSINVETPLESGKDSSLQSNKEDFVPIISGPSENSPKCEKSFRKLNKGYPDLGRLVKGKFHARHSSSPHCLASARWPQSRRGSPIPRPMFEQDKHRPPPLQTFREQAKGKPHRPETGKSETKGVDPPHPKVKPATSSPTVLEEIPSASSKGIHVGSRSTPSTSEPNEWLGPETRYTIAPNRYFTTYTLFDGISQMWKIIIKATDMKPFSKSLSTDSETADDITHSERLPESQKSVIKLDEVSNDIPWNETSCIDKVDCSFSECLRPSFYDQSGNPIALIGSDDENVSKERRIGATGSDKAVSTERRGPETNLKFHQCCRSDKVDVELFNQPCTSGENHGNEDLKPDDRFGENKRPHSYGGDVDGSDIKKQLLERHWPSNLDSHGDTQVGNWSNGLYGKVKRPNPDEFHDVGHGNTSTPFATLNVVDGALSEKIPIKQCNGLPWALRKEDQEMCGIAELSAVFSTDTLVETPSQSKQSACDETPSDPGNISGASRYLLKDQELGRINNEAMGLKEHTNEGPGESVGEFIIWQRKSSEVGNAPRPDDNAVLDANSGRGKTARSRQHTDNDEESSSLFSAHESSAPQDGKLCLISQGNEEVGDLSDSLKDLSRDVSTSTSTADEQSHSGVSSGHAEDPTGRTLLEAEHDETRLSLADREEKQRSECETEVSFNDLQGAALDASLAESGVCKKRVVQKSGVITEKCRVIVSQSTKENSAQKISPNFAREARGIVIEKNRNKRRWELRERPTKVLEVFPEETPKEHLIDGLSSDETFREDSQQDERPENSRRSEQVWRGKTLEFPLRLYEATEETEEAEEFTRVLALEEPQRNVYVTVTCERANPRKAHTSGNFTLRSEARRLYLPDDLNDRVSRRSVSPVRRLVCEPEAFAGKSTENARRQIILENGTSSHAVTRPIFGAFPMGLSWAGLSLGGSSDALRGEEKREEISPSPSVGERKRSQSGYSSLGAGEGDSDTEFEEFHEQGVAKDSTRADTIACDRSYGETIGALNLGSSLSPWELTFVARDTFSEEQSRVRKSPSGANGELVSETNRSPGDCAPKPLEHTPAWTKRPEVRRIGSVVVIGGDDWTASCDRFSRRRESTRGARPSSKSPEKKLSSVNTMFCNRNNSGVCLWHETKTAYCSREPFGTNLRKSNSFNDTFNELESVDTLNFNNDQQLPEVEHVRFSDNKTHFKSMRKMLQERSKYREYTIFTRSKEDKEQPHTRKTLRKNTAEVLPEARSCVAFLDINNCSNNDWRNMSGSFSGINDTCQVCCGSVCLCESCKKCSLDPSGCPMAREFYDRRVERWNKWKRKCMETSKSASSYEGGATHHSFKRVGDKGLGNTGYAELKSKKTQGQTVGKTTRKQKRGTVSRSEERRWGGKDGPMSGSSKQPKRDVARSEEYRSRKGAKRVGKDKEDDDDDVLEVQTEDDGNLEDVIVCPCPERRGGRRVWKCRMLTRDNKDRRRLREEDVSSSSSAEDEDVPICRDVSPPCSPVCGPRRRQRKQVLNIVLICKCGEEKRWEAPQTELPKPTAIASQPAPELQDKKPSSEDDLGKKLSSKDNQRTSAVVLQKSLALQTRESIFATVPFPVPTKPSSPPLSSYAPDSRTTQFPEVAAESDQRSEESVPRTPTNTPRSSGAKSTTSTEKEKRSSSGRGDSQSLSADKDRSSGEFEVRSVEKVRHDVSLSSLTSLIEQADPSGVSPVPPDGLPEGDRGDGTASPKHGSLDGAEPSPLVDSHDQVGIREPSPYSGGESAAPMEVLAEGEQKSSAGEGQQEPMQATKPTSHPGGESAVPGEIRAEGEKTYSAGEGQQKPVQATEPSRYMPVKFIAVAEKTPSSGEGQKKSVQTKKPTRHPGGKSAVPAVIPAGSEKKSGEKQGQQELVEAAKPPAYPGGESAAPVAIRAESDKSAGEGQQKPVPVKFIAVTEKKSTPGEEQKKPMQATKPTSHLDGESAVPGEIRAESDKTYSAGEGRQEPVQATEASRYMPVKFIAVTEKTPSSGEGQKRPKPTLHPGGKSAVPAEIRAGSEKKSGAREGQQVVPVQVRQPPPYPGRAGAVPVQVLAEIDNKYLAREGRDGSVASEEPSPFADIYAQAGFSNYGGTYGIPVDGGGYIDPAYALKTDEEIEVFDAMSPLPQQVIDSSRTFAESDMNVFPSRSQNPSFQDVQDVKQYHVVRHVDTDTGIIRTMPVSKESITITSGENAFVSENDLRSTLSGTKHRRQSRVHFNRPSLYLTQSLEQEIEEVEEGFVGNENKSALDDWQRSDRTKKSGKSLITATSGTQTKRRKESSRRRS